MIYGVLPFLLSQQRNDVLKSSGTEIRFEFESACKKSLGVCVTPKQKCRVGQGLNGSWILGRNGQELFNQYLGGVETAKSKCVGGLQESGILVGTDGIPYSRGLGTSVEFQFVTQRVPGVGVIRSEID